MKWTETITPKQAAEELGVPYHGWMREMDRAWISEDQKYSVMSRLLRTEWGKVEHVTITAAEGVGRSDGSGDIPWAVKMEIKNDLFGEKRVAVEVFPTQDRLVDVCDCYHLWVFEKGFRLPFGINPRDKKTEFGPLTARDANTASKSCWKRMVRLICPSAPMLT